MTETPLTFAGRMGLSLSGKPEINSPLGIRLGDGIDDGLHAAVKEL